jgi:hypothetical protein
MSNATKRQNQDAQTLVLKARIKLTTGLAMSTSSRHSTPAQNSIPKKIPTKTIPVPRSGCFMMSTHGIPTMRPGRQRSSIDFGASRFFDSTSASINTTASFANSAG